MSCLLRDLSIFYICHIFIYDGNVISITGICNKAVSELDKLDKLKI